MKYNKGDLERLFKQGKYKEAARLTREFLQSMFYEWNELLDDFDLYLSKNNIPRNYWFDECERAYDNFVYADEDKNVFYGMADELENKDFKY